MAELSDEEVFGSAEGSRPSAELSDAQVFGAAPRTELSDADVFGAPSPGLGAQALEVGKRFIGGAVEGIASTARGFGGLMAQREGSDPLEQAIVMTQQGFDPSEATAAVQNQQPSFSSATEQPAYQAGEALSSASRAALNPQPNVIPKLVEDVAGGFGSVAGNIATAFIPGAVGTLLVQGSGEATQRAVEGGATPEQQAQAAQLGGFAGATELVDALLPMLGSTGKALGFINRVGRRTVMGALAEGGQEGVQQLIQNAIAKGIYKPEQDLTQDVAYNALVGAIVGGTVSGVVGGMGGQPAQPTPAEMQAAYEAMKGGPPVFNPSLPPGETLRQWMGGALEETPVQVAASVMGLPIPDPLPTYYSNVLRVAGEKLPESGSSEQMLATIRNQPGVKAEEIEATGLDSFLASQRGRVSRDEVVEYLEENQIRVEEVVHDTNMQVPGRALQFQEYRTPGPTQGYREIVLTLPMERPSDLRRQAELRARDTGGDSLTQSEREELSNIVRGRSARGDRGPAFSGSHWSEPNVVSHVRFTDRTARSGQRVLHVEEIQSDWHQAGRRSGYIGGKTGSSFLAQASPLEGHAVPEAPFKTSWPELTFKRVLRWAADNGYSRISWNNGDLAAKYAAGGVTDPKTIAGLKEFYDKIIPSIARRWAKRLGGMVGATDIQVDETTTFTPAQAIGVRGWGVRADNSGRVYSLFDPTGVGDSYFATTEAEVQEWIAQQDSGGVRTVQHLDIPERARSYLQQGLPLFSALRPEDMRVFVDPTTVQQLVENDPFTLAMQKASLVLAKLAKEFKLDTKVRLILKSEQPAVIMERTVARAYASRYANGTYSITVHTPGYQNVTDFYVDLMHEFGHVVFWEHFTRLPDTSQRAIRADYQRFLETRRTDRTVGDIARRRDNAINVLRNRRPMTMALNELNQEQREYWYHFEEWMAEQVARWATSTVQPLTLAERIYKGLGTKLALIFQKASQALGLDFRPPENVQRWLDSFMTSAPPFAAKVYDDLDLRSQQENQRRIDESEPGLEAVPQQPETDGLRQVVNSMMSSMPPGPQKAALAQLPAFADKFNLFYKWMTHVFQLGELNPNLAPLHRYLEKIRAANVDESKINDAAIRVLKEWDNLGRKQGENLAGLLDAVTNMTYRTPGEVARGVGRHPTAAEFAALAATHKVSAEGLAVFQKITTLFDRFLDVSSQLAMQEAMKITDPVARANAVDAVVQNVKNLKSRPYFPFMRFGRHVVVVRNAAGVVVHREHFERRGLSSAESQQKRAIPRLEAAFPGHKVVPDILAESAEPMIGMPGLMLNMMAQKLALTPLQVKALEQLRFEMAPAQSFRHRFQHKSYVAGYSQDFKRAFSQYFFNGAKWYVKVKYADGLRADIQDTHNSLDTSTTPTKRLKIANFMADHLEKGFLNPALDFITFKAALVLWTLAFVPLSALVNMSQTPMVTLNFLSDKFGLPGLSDVRAARELTKAIGNWRNYYKKGKYETLTDADGKALNYAIRTGRLDQTLAAELASWSQGSNLGTGYGGTLPARALHSGLQKGMWMFEMAEKWNRRVAFMATLNLARRHPNAKYVHETLSKYHDELASMVASGFSQAEAQAIIVANHTVDQTQFMGTTESRPKFMRGKLGSVFLYKRFIQGLLFLGANNKAGFLPRFAIMMLAVGGLHGLPGYDDAEETARVLGWWLFGKDFKMSREIRNLVSQLTDNTSAADQILHGTSRMGAGIPWLLNAMGSQVGMPKAVPSVDFSRSIGPGTVLPVELGKLFGPPIADPNKMFGEQSARATGVMGGLALNMYKAIASKESPGDFKKWESAMPRFARNLSHSYRAFTEEKERGRSDSTVIQYNVRDPEHLGEIVGIIGGFQPRRLTAKWNELRDQGEIIKFFDTQRDVLLAQWTKAYKDGEVKEIDRMRTATLEFNADLPEWARGKTITRETIERSVRGRLRTQELHEAGLSPQRSNIPIVEEMQRLHPEAAPFDVRRVR